MEDSPFYQYILDLGMEEGVEKGRREGGIQAMQNALLHQGQKKFGAPSKAIRLEIHGIQDHDILDSLLLRLLDVGNWTDLLEGAPEPCAKG